MKQKYLAPPSEPPSHPNPRSPSLPVPSIPTSPPHHITRAFGGKARADQGNQAHTHGSGSPPPGHFTPTTSLSGASPHKLPVEDTPKQPPPVIDTAATDMDNYVASRPSLSDVPDPRQSYLQTDHDLSYYGIYVHLFHHLFICTQCETAVTSDRLPAHLHEHYPEGSLQTPDHQTFDQLVACACLKWGIPNPQDHFAPPPPGSCPIEGVTIHQEGWQCNLCDHACTTKNSITRHVAAYHKAKAQDPPDTLYWPSPVQKLFEAQWRCYFSVDLHLLPSAAGDPYSLYVTDHPIAPSEVSPPAIERDIPLLLRETDWHIHFTSELVDPSVRAATQTLLASAKKNGRGRPTQSRHGELHLHDQDVLVRRLLAKDGSGPFQPLREPKTIRDYLSHAINFLSLCIRTLLNLSTAAYCFSLSTDQFEAVDRLLLGLRDGGTPSHTDVQAAFWILLCMPSATPTMADMEDESRQTSLHTEEFRKGIGNSLTSLNASRPLNPKIDTSTSNRHNSHVFGLLSGDGIRTLIESGDGTAMPVFYIIDMRGELFHFPALIGPRTAKGVVSGVAELEHFEQVRQGDDSTGDLDTVLRSSGQQSDCGQLESGTYPHGKPLNMFSTRNAMNCRWRFVMLSLRIGNFMRWQAFYTMMQGI
ncbi:hypothetical protein JB92DRAFT_2830292 [Gautieria morchelliformis]|nr:hypothetical protein JB92DRAFT_2830292 [Gautieria morchelliformis]